LYWKPALKEISKRRRNWAKIRQLFLTPKNRANSKTITHDLKILDRQIQRAYKRYQETGKGKYRVNSLFRMRKRLFALLVSEVASDFDAWRYDYTKDIGELLMVEDN